MSRIAKVIGYVYLVAWALSCCGLADMYVCIGKPGACASTLAKKGIGL